MVHGVVVSNVVVVDVIGVDASDGDVLLLLLSCMLNCLIQRNITPFTICSELRL